MVYLVNSTRHAYACKRTRAGHYFFMVYLVTCGEREREIERMLKHLMITRWNTDKKTVGNNIQYVSDGYPNVRNSYVKNNALFVIEINDGNTVHYIPLASIYSIKETSMKDKTADAPSKRE